MQQYSKEIESFLNFVRSSVSELMDAEETERFTEQQTQDILHQIELKDNTQFDYICEGISLRDVRKKRREAKDRRTILTLIVDWSTENQSAINSLEQILGQVRKEERKAEQRFYTSRTDVLGYLFGKQED